MKNCLIIILFIIGNATSINCQTQTANPLPVEVIEKWLNGSDLDSIRPTLRNCGLSIHEEYDKYIEEWFFKSLDFENQRRSDIITSRYLFCTQQDNPNQKMVLVTLICRWGHPYAKSFMKSVKRSFPKREFESHTMPCMDCSERERNREHHFCHFSRPGSDISVTLRWTWDEFGLHYNFSRGY